MFTSHIVNMILLVSMLALCAAAALSGLYAWFRLITKSAASIRENKTNSPTPTSSPAVPSEETVHKVTPIRDRPVYYSRPTSPRQSMVLSESMAAKKEPAKSSSSDLITSTSSSVDSSVSSICSMF